MINDSQLHCVRLLSLNYIWLKGKSGDEFTKSIDVNDIIMPKSGILVDLV